MIVKRRRVEGRLELSIVTKYDTNDDDGDFHFRKNRNLKMNTGSFCIPKDNNERPLGEDSHFICQEKFTIGVADGVGGWAREGIDAGEYARELMNNCVLALQDEIKGRINPRRVLQEAYSNTKNKGSSTALIMSLNSNSCLHYVNLGDSGFMLFRDKKYVYRSSVQQHGFNHPYQLGSRSGDTPSLAQEDVISVEAGDIIVAGTDGLFDNMYPSKIEEILNETEEKKEICTEQLAWIIAECALFNSLDEDYLSPFARDAKIAGLSYEGGKYDDITAIVVQIQSV